MENEHQERKQTSATRNAPSATRCAQATSVVEICGKYASKCGYCRRPGKTSVSYGINAKCLTCADYQALIDRGWRRSGMFLYKPIMNETCCPQYSIRLDANAFQPSKSQRQVLRRLRRFVDGGDSAGVPSLTGGGISGGGRSGDSVQESLRDVVGDGVVEDPGVRKTRHANPMNTKKEELRARSGHGEHGNASKGTKEAAEGDKTELTEAVLEAINAAVAAGALALPAGEVTRERLGMAAHVRVSHIPSLGDYSCAVARKLTALMARQRAGRGTPSAPIPWTAHPFPAVSPAPTPEPVSVSPAPSFSEKSVVAEGRSPTTAEATSTSDEVWTPAATAAVLASFLRCRDGIVAHAADNGFLNFVVGGVRDEAAMPVSGDEALDGTVGAAAAVPATAAHAGGENGRISAGSGSANSVAAGSRKGAAAGAGSSAPDASRERKRGQRASPGKGKGHLRGATKSGDRLNGGDGGGGSAGPSGVSSGVSNGAGTHRNAGSPSAPAGAAIPAPPPLQPPPPPPQPQSSPEKAAAAAAAATAAAPPLGGVLGPGPHRFTVETVPARFSEEVFALYRVYQVCIHNDDPAELTPSAFRRFLVESPLVREPLAPWWSDQAGGATAAAAAIRRPRDNLRRNTGDHGGGGSSQNGHDGEGSSHNGHCASGSHGGPGSGGGGGYVSAHGCSGEAMETDSGGTAAVATAARTALSRVTGATAATSMSAGPGHGAAAAWTPLVTSLTMERSRGSGGSGGGASGGRARSDHSIVGGRGDSGSGGSGGRGTIDGDSSGHGETAAAATAAAGLGTYHQLYRLDGSLVAVGVIDLLPGCLSSVYCFYDPACRALALGKVAALCEIDWVGQAQALRPSLHFYYLGYYIHSCPKMSYKGSYAPSELLCPERFEWVPFDNRSRAALSARPYAVLSSIAGSGGDGGDGTGADECGSGGGGSSDVSGGAMEDFTGADEGGRGGDDGSGGSGLPGWIAAGRGGREGQRNETKKRARGSASVSSVGNAGPSERGGAGDDGGSRGRFDSRDPMVTEEEDAAANLLAHAPPVEARVSLAVSVTAACAVAGGGNDAAGELTTAGGALEATSEAAAGPAASADISNGAWATNGEKTAASPMVSNDDEGGGDGCSSEDEGAVKMEGSDGGGGGGGGDDGWNGGSSGDDRDACNFSDDEAFAAAVQWPDELTEAAHASALSVPLLLGPGTAVTTKALTPAGQNFLLPTLMEYSAMVGPELARRMVVSLR